MRGWVLIHPVGVLVEVLLGPESGLVLLSGLQEKLGYQNTQDHEAPEDSSLPAASAFNSPK